MVGLRLGKVADALVEEREGGIGGHISRVHLAQVTQFFLLAGTHDGELTELALWLFHHPGSDSGNALGQTTAHALAVERVVILDHHAARLNLDVDFELGNVEFQQFLPDRLTTHGVLREHAHLISIGDGRTEAVVSSDAGKGVILVAQRLVKRVACILQELVNRYIVDAHAQCEGVDKHAHGVGNLEITAAAAHGAQVNVAVVGVT